MMKPKFRLLFTVFLCSISSVLIAQSVNIHTAKAIAGNYLATFSKPSLKSAGSQGKCFNFTSVKAAVEKKDTLYYILNDTINKGFVIVSADKRVRPILGYSTEGSFNEKKQPEAFTAWMDNRKKEIEYIKKNNLQPDNETKASWQNLSLKSSAIETTSVEPLIQTQWDQGCYYNSLCPADAAGPCGHAYTGCTITAMAQIMKYWNYPTKGTGSHSYSHPTYGELSADFGATTYQWSQMPNSVTSQNDAVTTLMYHCGVSLDADYGPVVTSALDPRDALVQYFNYSSNAMLVDRSGFTTSEWADMLKSELDLQHPIWYEASGSVGHSFICDGYQDADYFHFNWGWSGSCDGYFFIGNLNPSGYYLNENQYALKNILPGNLPDGYNGFFVSANSVVIDTNGGITSVDVCSSASWTASSDQSWLSLSTKTGVSGKTTLILTATENQTESDRSATITISAAGFNNQTIAVSQFTNKMNVTPGELHNLISKYATVITKLTLAGTIDARDFKTMRDAMPVLTDLDLSDVTIAAYKGVDGTNSGDNAYNGNTIPPVAFTLSCNKQNRLKSIILPATITSIKAQAFGSSKDLTSLNIPSTVTNIEDLAFNSCFALINVDPDNPKYSSIDGELFSKNRTKFIHCPISLTGNYTIPASVDSIGVHAFAYCKGLTSVTIPSSVTTIEFFSFLKCSGLISVYIPSSVTTIQQEAFDGCSGLINVDTNNVNYSSKDGILFDKTQATIIQCPTSKTGIYTIPSSAKSIGRYAFSGCIGLTSVTIPSSVTTIELSAFQACTGLTNITIPSTVTSIEYGTFYNCTGLLSVIMPSSINSIQDWTLGGCIGLRSIYVCTKSPPRLDNFLDVFTRVNKTSCTLFVPYGSKADYQVAAQWKDFTNVVEMPGFKISATTANVKAAQGSIASIDISSNAICLLNSDQPWLKVSLEKSNEISTLNFIADENASDTLRIATITVSATGVESQTITVTQEAKYITGIDQLSIKPEVMIYPNPTTGKVLLVFDKVPVDGISLTVNDLNGKICLKQLIRDKEGWIDLSGNVPGIYFIKTDQENIKAQKVILK